MILLIALVLGGLALTIIVTYAIYSVVDELIYDLRHGDWGDAVVDTAFLMAILAVVLVLIAPLVSN